MVQLYVIKDTKTGYYLGDDNVGIGNFTVCDGSYYNLEVLQANKVTPTLAFVYEHDAFNLIKTYSINKLKENFYPDVYEQNKNLIVEEHCFDFWSGIEKSNQTDLERISDLLEYFRLDTDLNPYNINFEHILVSFDKRYYSDKTRHILVYESKPNKESKIKKIKELSENIKILDNDAFVFYIHVLSEKLEDINLCKTVMAEFRLLFESNEEKLIDNIFAYHRKNQ